MGHLHRVRKLKRQAVVMGITGSRSQLGNIDRDGNNFEQGGLLAESIWAMHLLVPDLGVYQEPGNEASISICMLYMLMLGSLFKNRTSEGATQGGNLLNIGNLTNVECLATSEFLIIMDIFPLFSFSVSGKDCVCHGNNDTTWLCPLREGLTSMLLMQLGAQLMKLWVSYIIL